MTKILKINPHKPQAGKIKEAAIVIKKGGIVAFPTETVYGLGANALNAEAVKKIFEAKKRPIDNPLIVHIFDISKLGSIAINVPKDALKAAKEFWPGPLTMVLHKNKEIPPEVTAGLDTVAVRMPMNEIAIALIKESGVPIAAPSANLASRPSPTKAEHVIEDLMGRVDIIIDGGETEIGLESTIVDMTVTPPVILRPGKITLEDLKKVLSNVVLNVQSAKDTPKAPGMKYKHYAPSADLIIVKGDEAAVNEKIRYLATQAKKAGLKVGIISHSNNKFKEADLSLCLGNDLSGFAHRLFSALRDFDKAKVNVIFAEAVCEKGIGTAIMNRMNKASYEIIKA
ncbi:MAG: L-threonylcarbamoyladenylate synthase [archaeon]